MGNIKSIGLFMQVNVLAAHNWETYNEKIRSLHAPAMRFVGYQLVYSISNDTI